MARDVIKAEKVLDYSVKDNIAERFAKRPAPAPSMASGKVFRRRWAHACSPELYASIRNTVGRRSTSAAPFFQA